MNGRTRKKTFVFSRSESYRARRKATDKSSQLYGSRGYRPRPRVHTHETRAAYSRPNAAQSLPKPTPEKRPAGVGPTSAKKSSRRQEVADEEPFRYTTAGYPISYRGQAMDTQRHRLRYSGVEQPLQGSSSRPAYAFSFPKPVRGSLGASCGRTRECGCPKINTRLLVLRRFGISEPGKTQLVIAHPRKKQATSKTKSPSSSSIMPIRTAHRKPRGHKPTNTPGINLESSAS